MSEKEPFIRALEASFAKAEIVLSPEDSERISAHFALMKKWNRAINLTRITDAQKAASWHYLDCARGVEYLKGARRVADIGSGPGFPGVVLAILMPEVRFSLVETSEKKVSFLKAAERLLALENLEVHHGRWPKDFQADFSFDGIVSRATFSDKSAFLSTLSSFQSLESVVLWAGSEDAPTLEGYEKNAHSYRLAEADKERSLIHYLRSF